MINVIELDRRAPSKAPLYATRRRYPRVAVRCGVFYESDGLSLLSEKANVSLRGLFLPCGNPEREGTRAVLRLDTGKGALLKLGVEVLRAPELGQSGMALRIVEISDPDRYRLGAFLLEKGGLSVLPQLDRHFKTLTRAPRPRQLRRAG